MTRAYHIIDADGHVLEPVDLWDKYIDPAYRDRAPRMIIDTDGKERLLVEGQVLGSKKGFNVVGAIGSRQGGVPEATMKYVDGRASGFDPHARIPDMDLDGIDAAFLYPSVGLFAGSPTTAIPTPTAYSEWRCCRCSRSSSPSRRCASPGESWACAAASYAPTPTTGGPCTTPRTRRSGKRRRTSTSRSACTRAPAAGCRRWAWTGSRRAGRGTSSPTPWR